MNKWIPVIAGGLFILVSFQNCSPEGSSQNQNPNSLAQTKIEDPDLKSATSIQIHTSDESTEITLNLQSGELVQRNLVSGQSATRCLNSSILGTINDLLQSSSLCESKAVIDEDRMCAQVYTSAYASLIWPNGSSQKVGESLNSCEKGPDLCGQDGALLRGLLRDVVARWSEWSCDFQPL